MALEVVFIFWQGEIRTFSFVREGVRLTTSAGFIMLMIYWTYE
jgi:hypothetical protein